MRWKAQWVRHVCLVANLDQNLVSNNTYHFNFGGEPRIFQIYPYSGFLLHFTVRIIILLMRCLWRLVIFRRRSCKPKFEDKVLSRFERLETQVSVRMPSVISLRFRVEEGYAADEVKEDWQSCGCLVGSGWKYRLKPAIWSATNFRVYCW